MLWVLFLTLEMGGCEQNFGTICVLVVMNVVTGKTAARGPQCPLTGWLSLSLSLPGSPSWGRRSWDGGLIQNQPAHWLAWDQSDSLQRTEVGDGRRRVLEPGRARRREQMCQESRRHNQRDRGERERQTDMQTAHESRAEGKP